MRWGWKTPLVGALAWTLLGGQSVQALYEDQMGEFDWTIENLGRAQHVVFGGSDKRIPKAPVRGSARALYIASDERSRSLARLDAKTGAIKWRRLFDEGDSVDALELTNYGLISVSGQCKNLRMWDLADGALVWDEIAYVGPRQECANVSIHAVGDDRVLVLSTTQALLSGLQDGRVHWKTPLSALGLSAVQAPMVSDDQKTIHVLGKTEASSQPLLIAFNALTGKHTVNKDEKLEGMETLLQLTDAEGIVAVGVHERAVKVVSLGTSGDVSQTLLGDLNIAAGTVLGVDQSSTTDLILKLSSGERVLCRVDASNTVESVHVMPRNGILVEAQSEGPSVFHIDAPAQKKNVVEIASYSSDTGVPSIQWDVELDLNLYGGAVINAFVGCSPKKKEHAPSRCRALLLMQDESLVMTSNEETADTEAVEAEGSRNVMWIRDEALANVKEVHWITPAETEMEKQPLAGIPSFTEELALEWKRMTLLVDQMVAFTSSFMEENDRGKSVRSRTRAEPENSHFFGFSKYILLLSESGRLFAIRAETNEIVWSKYVGSTYRLFVLRDHAALGSGAELLLVSDTAPLMWLDGEDGHEIEQLKDSTGAGAPYWTVLLPKHKHHATDNEVIHRRGVARISSDSLAVDIFPKEAMTHFSDLEHFYFHRYDAATKSFSGYTIAAQEDGTYQAKQVWSHVLAVEQTLAATSHQMEPWVIDSSVATTGDDSLLLKYLNPHMFGISTVSMESVEGQEEDTSVVHVSLVDAVSGRVIHRVRHEHASGPVQMIQNAQWVVYSFWNAKDKRTEMVQLLLYEGAVGKHQLNPWRRPSWNDWRSSFDPRPPFVLQKSFVYPSRIRTLGATVTARGITPQFVLVGMENGQIYKLSRGWINPRQTEKPPTEQEQGEGLMQYSPLVPLFKHPSAMVTYNKTIGQLQHISSYPAELESTTLVFAYGLDLHYVRMSPAKSFDLLPSDFNYELLVLLCISFIVATVVSRKVARRKALLEAWK